LFLTKNFVVKLMIRCQSHDILLNFFWYKFYLWFGSLLYYFDIATLIDLVDQFIFLLYVVCNIIYISFSLNIFYYCNWFHLHFMFLFIINISRFIKEILWLSLRNWHYRVVYVIFRHIIYKLIILNLYVLCVTVI